MHEENSFVKRELQIIITMKNSLLLDSRLLLNFWEKIMVKANYL